MSGVLIYLGWLAAPLLCFGLGYWSGYRDGTGK